MKRWMTCGACLAALAGLGAACGAKEAEVVAPVPARSAEGDEGHQDGLAVSGILGTLSQDEIQGALAPRMNKLSRCVSQRWSANEWLSGELELYFHVAPDGAVTSVVPTRSSFGDRAAERCMLEVALATRFPRPHGGAAEFSWSLEVALDASVEPPVALDGALAREALAEWVEPLRQNCQLSSVTVTAYVDEAGKVVTAGAVAQEASPEQLDCVADGVAAWTFPSPGARIAKLTLAL